MALTTESCRQCEHLAVVLESASPLGSVRELPNTHDRHTGRYTWHTRGFFGYALVPRSVRGKQGIIDAYFCMDEDDLDDIDVQGYFDKYLRERVLRRWKNFKIVEISEPALASPEGILCRKIRHTPLGEIPAAAAGVE
jgi:hypothetical protein